MSKSKFMKSMGDRAKLDGVNTHSAPPHLWLSTGNYAMNKVISGRFDRGYAVGRLAMVTGPSDSGKSFVAMSAAVQAQKNGYGVFIVDSENAIDDNYMEAVGLDTNDDLLMYNSVNSLESAKSLISNFISEYRENKDDLPPFLLLIDSLDELRTKAHVEKEEKGVIHNDQGQKAKQLKQLGGDIMHEIRDLDIFAVATKQPYKNQDLIMSKVEPYIITESMKYPFSQIIMLTNRKVKDAKTKTIEGIALNVLGYKTRFAKPRQKVTIDVPYDTGIDPFNGLLDIAESLDVVSKKGAWYTYNDEKFQANSASEVILNSVLQDLIELDGGQNQFVDTVTEEEESDD